MGPIFGQYPKENIFFRRCSLIYFIIRPHLIPILHLGSRQHLYILYNAATSYTNLTSWKPPTSLCTVYNPAATSYQSYILRCQQLYTHFTLQPHLTSSRSPQAMSHSANGRTCPVPIANTRKLPFFGSLKKIRYKLGFCPNCLTPPPIPECWDSQKRRKNILFILLF